MAKNTVRLLAALTKRQKLTDLTHLFVPYGPRICSTSCVVRAVRARHETTFEKATANVELRCIAFRACSFLPLQRRWGKNINRWTNRGSAKLLHLSAN